MPADYTTLLQPMSYTYDLCLRLNPYGRSVAQTIELLKQAHAIIDGIPDRYINLSHWIEGYASDGGIIECIKELSCEEVSCGCAGGWLALHPEMRALGLLMWFGVPDLRAGPERFRAVANVGAGYWDGMWALAAFFGLSYVEARDLFKGSGDAEQAEHKQLWLARCRRLIGTYEFPES